MSIFFFRIWRPGGGRTGEGDARRKVNRKARGPRGPRAFFPSAVPFAIYRKMASIRRFCRFPSGVELSAIGREEP